MNFSDLFIVVALASALYALIVAVTRQKHFLKKAVNPHRGTWFIAAAATLWVGISLIRWEAGTWNLVEWGSLLRQLVTEEPATVRVKVASISILLGIVLLTLLVWCILFLPRDPSTFYRPEDRKRAFRYYVSKLKGGLDYALLATGDGDILEEAVNEAKIACRADHLPKVQPKESDLPRPRTADDQVQAWRAMARTLYLKKNELDRLIESALHGRNRRIHFDAEYGGMFFKYLRDTDPHSKIDSGLYLFAATLNQLEIDNDNAEKQFQFLLDALANIERSIRLA